MLTCEYCKKEFIVSKVRQKCCSLKCWHKLNYEKHKEEIKSASRRWYDENRERKKQYQREKYAGLDKTKSEE